MTATGIACGSDAEDHVARLRKYVAAGFDELSVSPVGPGYRGFFDFYGSGVLPEMGSA